MSATLLRSAAAPAATADPSTRARWTGRVLSGLAIVFLTVDVGFKFVATPEALEATVGLGWQPHQMPILGVIGAVCLLLYVVPRTAPFGALLWTGYLGGAIATHLRIGNPLATHVLFPIYVAALIWGGLYLRDARVRAFVRAER